MKPGHYWKLAVPLAVFSQILFWNWIVGLLSASQGDSGTVFTLFLLAGMPIAIAGLLLFAVKQKAGFFISLGFTALSVLLAIFAAIPGTIDFSQFDLFDSSAGYLWLFAGISIVSLAAIWVIFKSKKIFLEKPKKEKIFRAPARSAASVLLSLRGIFLLMLSALTVPHLLVAFEAIFFPDSIFSLQEIGLEILVWGGIFVWGLADAIAAIALWRLKKNSELLGIGLAVLGVLFVNVLVPMFPESIMLWNVFAVYSVFLMFPYLLPTIWIVAETAIGFNALLIILMLLSIFWERLFGKKTISFNLPELKHLAKAHLAKIFPIIKKPLLAMLVLAIVSFLFFLFAYGLAGIVSAVSWPILLFLAVYSGYKTEKELHAGVIQAGISGAVFGLVFGIMQEIATLLLFGFSPTVFGADISELPVWEIAAIILLFTAMLFIISAVIGFALGAVGGIAAKKFAKNKK